MEAGTRARGAGVRERERESGDICLEDTTYQTSPIYLLLRQSSLSFPYFPRVLEDALFVVCSTAFFYCESQKLKTENGKKLIIYT